MKINQLLGEIEEEMDKLKEIPNSIAAFNALEVTLQDLARKAHHEASELARPKIPK